MRIHKKLFAVAVAMLMASGVNAQTTTSAYYDYEVECLGVELDGSQTVRVWGVGRNKKDAVEQAKKNAVRVVLFKGIQGGLKGCNTNERRKAREPVQERQGQGEKQAFREIWRDGESASRRTQETLGR